MNFYSVDYIGRKTGASERGWGVCAHQTLTFSVKRRLVVASRPRSSSSSTATTMKLTALVLSLLALMVSAKRRPSDSEHRVLKHRPGPKSSIPIGGRMLRRSLNVNHYPPSPTHAPEHNDYHTKVPKGMEREWLSLDRSRTLTHICRVFEPVQARGRDLRRKAKVRLISHDLLRSW